MKRSMIALAVEAAIIKSDEPSAADVMDTLTKASSTEKYLEMKKATNVVGKDNEFYKRELSRVIQGAVKAKVDTSSSDSSSDTSSAEPSDESQDSQGGEDFGMGDMGGGDDMADDTTSTDSGADEDSTVKKPDTEDKKDSDKKEDTKEDDTQKDDKDASKEEVKEKKDSTAQESLRLTNIELFPHKESLAVEFDAGLSYLQASEEANDARTDRVFLDEEPIGHKIVNWAGNKALNIAHFLKEIGIEYGPKILTFLGQAGLTIATESAKAVIGASSNLKRFLHKKMNSFDSLSKEISELENKVMLYSQSSPNAKPHGEYDQEKNIALLKIGTSLKVIPNLKNMVKFTEESVVGITGLFDNEAQTILHLMSIDATSNKHNVPGMMGAANFGSVLKKGTLKGYEPKYEDVVGYISNSTGIGDIKIVAHVPNEGINDISVMKKAYNQSGMFLGMDLAHIQGASSIPYLDVKELMVLLKTMSELAIKCKHHENKYKDIDNKINTLGTKLNAFFSSLVGGKEKLSVEDTTMEYVYMKLGFINKVYLPCMMDIHEYNIKVLKAAINYVHRNMSALKPE